MLRQSLRPQIFISHRYFSKHLSAVEVRQHFLDYFQSSGHSHIRSSPVKPFNDSTLEFVNAGMNQFKNVFLGLSPPPCQRAVNSQKCIRIGGKHNDLDSVGYDTYHHTFFEMLGNWSFGNYFKKEACQLAWQLITSPPYSLPPNRLYVTYFGGDEKLGLEADLETKEICVTAERLIPFGANDNFWEMGLTGPCGPSTEIHYDHLSSIPRPNQVNSDLTDLTELWNLVFIQYNREENGHLKELSQSYVDTGMGLERLVAIMQKKSSNYDTDLFTPLFQKIATFSNVPEYNGKFGDDLATSYRILADHARMLTIAIADNMFPDQCHALRRVVRKSLIIANQFSPKGSDLLIELTKVVANSVQDIYPETVRNIRQIEYVLRDEADTFEKVKSQVKDDWKKMLVTNPNYTKLTDVQSPGLIAGIKEILETKLKKGDILNPSLALMLYDRHGLSPSLIEEISAINGYEMNKKQLLEDISVLKDKYKTNMSTVQNKIFHSGIQTSLANFPPTDETLKFQHKIEPLDTNVYKIVSSGSSLLENNTEIGLLLERTNFWTSIKGDGDQGLIELKDRYNDKIGTVDVRNAIRYGDHIIHYGNFTSDSSYDSELNDLRATISINKEHRMALMRNTTASHLLTRVMKDKYVANIQSFSNTKHNFTIKYAVYGQDISEGDCILMEYLVNKMIKEKLEIETTKISNKDLYRSSNIVIPPIVNVQSKDFPLIEIKDGKSIREISYGPNVNNTGDIREFCFVGVEVNRNKRQCVLKGITGPAVDIAYTKTEEILKSLSSFTEESPGEVISEEIVKAKQLVSENLVPVSSRVELNHLITRLTSIIKQQLLNKEVSLMKEAITVAENANRHFIVHYANEETKIEKLTKLSPDLPVLVFSYSKGNLTARCCCPEHSPISACEWMMKLSTELGGQAAGIKGQDPKQVSYLKPLKLNKDEVEVVLDKAKIIATKIAKELIFQNEGNKGDRKRIK